MDISLKRQSVLGVDITNESQSDILKYVVTSLQKHNKKYAIFTPNPEIVTYAFSHESYRRMLNQARINLCDGTGLFLASQVLGKPLKERISGVDFMENICKEIVRKPVTVGFLGGRGGVAKKTAECLQKKYPGLKVSFIAEEWNTASEARFRQSVVDILFVAFGFPKQEQWIMEHLPSLSVTVAMAVGGSFDYLSGSISRAPFMLRAVGLEWLYRLSRQPWRIKRQLKLATFVRLVYEERRRQKL